MKGGRGRFGFMVFVPPREFNGYPRVGVVLLSGLSEGLERFLATLVKRVTQIEEGQTGKRT